jgi:DNA transformation protein and related proteins
MDKKITIERICALFHPQIIAVARPMFGGYGIFSRGAMFALVTPKLELYLKTDERNRPAFQELNLKPHGKMPYYQAPAEAMASPRAMRRWAIGALSAAHNSAEKPKQNARHTQKSKAT